MQFVNRQQYWLLTRHSWRLKRHDCVNVLLYFPQICVLTFYMYGLQIAEATQRPSLVIGTHFFVPAYYMRLLEVVHHSAVSAQTVATTMALGKKIKKVENQLLQSEV